MPSRRLHILLLCDFHPGTATTIVEHIHAFPQFSQHHYYVLSNRGDLPAWLQLSRFDGVIVHYSLIACYDNYLGADARRRIRDFDGFKAVFVQDDYRWINDTVNALAYMRITALFPLAGPDIIDQVYSPERLPGVHRETVLTGYVPEELARRPVKPFAERPIDVGYRARKVPMWIGSHTLQKWQIADRFLADAPRYGLTVDLSYREEDRIYGEQWIEFVSSCKAMLGTESGASVCDFTGEIQRNVEEHMRRHPDATFDELRDRYFKDEDGRIMMNVISPRTFEAACLRTLMILYEGHYSGILEPWRHYVPLRADHSNMDEVVEILRTPAKAQEIIDRAYQEIALNPAYTFRAMVQRVDQIIADTYQPREERHGYSPAEFAWRTATTELDLTKYARVSSPLAISSEAPLASILSPLPDRRAVVSLPSQPLPHRIDLAFDPPLQVASVHLVWGSPAAAAVSGVVELMRRGATVARVNWDAPATQHTAVEMPSPRVRSNGIRLTFDAYHGSEQLCLHDLQLELETLPLRERLHRARIRLNDWLRHQISTRWMQLPPAGRGVLKRPLRATYDWFKGR